MAKDIKDLKIGILALGLIGGSLAKALRFKANIKNIVAFERKEHFIEMAKKDNAINEGTNKDFSIFTGCDIVFICSPVPTVCNFAKEIAKFTNGIITDVGSTKAEIMQNTKKLNFIGGHPMTGSEKSSYLVADERLFENAIYVLCKGQNCLGEDFETFKTLIETIGSIVVEMDGEEHDKAVGIISHLPHIVSAGLVNTASENDKGSLKQIAAGGFKDITRISSSNPTLWQEIVLSSDGAIIGILDEYIARIENIKNAILQKDSDTILRYFSTAKDYRDGMLDNIRGIMSSQQELWIDVSDKPGIIGNIATLLGENGINIKNINIQNNREYEGGCLRITIESYIQAEKAQEILNVNGYSSRKKK